MGKGSRVSLKNRRFPPSPEEKPLCISPSIIWEEGKNGPHLNGGCTCPEDPAHALTRLYIVLAQ